VVQNAIIVPQLPPVLADEQTGFSLLSLAATDDALSWPRHFY
jgi:hypothetical protein